MIICIPRVARYDKTQKDWQANVAAYDRCPDCGGWKMISTHYPIVTSKGTVTFPDGTVFPTHRTQCHECQKTFIAIDREDAQGMWWDHVREKHPSVVLAVT